MDEEISKKNSQPLAVLIGKQLASVEFVRDYLQLGFDGPYITALTWPAINVGEDRYQWGVPRYRDILCERIGRTVRAASVVEGQEILIEFDDGAVFFISLRPEDYSTAEAAIFHGESGDWAAW